MFDLAAAREAIGRQAILLPDPVPPHPLLDGKQEIGRGEYSIVLDKGDGERVYKIVSSPADYFLYTADDRPDLGELVHNLEHGFTMLWYDETAAADEPMMEHIEAIATKYKGTDNLRLKFKAVPWLKADGKPFPEGQHIAFTHWSNGGTGEAATGEQVGVWQYCSEPSGAAIKDFMVKYPYLDSPEPDAV